MKLIDDFLNNITMYRLVLYYLICLLIWALFLSLIGELSFNIPSLLITTSFILATSWLTNKIFAYVFASPTNLESIYITALILALVISPVTDVHSLPFIFWASVWASSSKFIFALNKKHLFNPAAAGILIASLGVTGSASWWVGTTYMMPAVLVGGILIIKKIRRWDLFFSFFASSLITIFTLSFFNSSQLIPLFAKIFLDSPILFFAFVMLTEPLTSPPNKLYRLFYGALTGFLFAPQLHFGTLYTTPESALIIGNTFSYLVSPKQKLVLHLKEKVQIGPGIIDFIFGLDKHFAYLPGQYMEWTLGYKDPDSRGNRRYFTLASSPTENSLRLGVRFNDPSSSFKKALFNLPVGGEITASSLSGEFTLPKNPGQKLVFIAGGIGVTPFRSFAKAMIDKGEKRDAILFYSIKSPAEAVYWQLFYQAQNLGLKTVITITDPKNVPPNWTGKTGTLTKDMLLSEVPDFKERKFYLSGPHGMVKAFEKTLSDLGLPKSQIKTDYFPGFA